MMSVRGPVFALGLAAVACAAPHAGLAQERVKTSGEVASSSLGGAMTAPLRDVNLIRTKIPPVLVAAIEDPYARPSPSTCATIIEQVAELNEALGEDLDVVVIRNASLMDRGKETAFNAVADLTTDVIPFRGWVRKLTGAEKHDKRVQAAVVAGGVRRAYLKGLGEARGCDPPATPSHLKSSNRQILSQADAPY